MNLEANSAFVGQATYVADFRFGDGHTDEVLTTLTWRQPRPVPRLIGPIAVPDRGGGDRTGALGSSRHRGILVRVS